MLRYWILSISKDNYLIAKERGIIGVTAHGKRAIEQMAIGDIITFYISKKSVTSSNDPAERIQKIRGIARVTGASFESNDVIWHMKPGELFPYRRHVEFLSDALVDGVSLLKDLSYITKSQYWALPLRIGYVEITERDFDKIQAALGTQF
jgi:predicted RNA-binding protein